MSAIDQHKLYLNGKNVNFYTDLCMGMCMSVLGVCVRVHGSQRTTFKGWFSPTM